MLDSESLLDLIKHELETDHAEEDVTTKAVLHRQTGRCVATVVSKEPGVFCGEKVVQAFGILTEGKIRLEAPLLDGSAFHAGSILVRLEGEAESCLGVERTLLNFLAHTCGIATLTRQFVDAVSPHTTKIMATRKTLPGLRQLELMAVSAGGGYPHRRSLEDGILIKDNHLEFVRQTEALKRARSVKAPLQRIEIEVQDLALLEELLDAPPDVIMLDNLDLDDLRKAIAKIDRRCEIEVSGGVQLENVAAIAALGVQYISVGRLTHSAPALNLSLEIIEAWSAP